MTVQWREDLPDDWEHAGDFPPPARDDPEPVDRIRPGCGVVWRRESSWIHIIHEAALVDVERCR